MRLVRTLLYLVLSGQYHLMNPSFFFLVTVLLTVVSQTLLVFWLVRSSLVISWPHTDLTETKYMLTADHHMLIQLKIAWVKSLRYSPKRTSLSLGKRVTVMQWICSFSGPVNNEWWFAQWRGFSGKVNYVTPDTLCMARDVLSAGKYTYFSLLRLKRQHCAALSWTSDLATGLLDKSTPATGKQKYLCL